MKRVAALLALWAAYHVGHRVAWFKWESSPNGNWFDGRSGS